MTVHMPLSKEETHGFSTAEMIKQLVMWRSIVITSVIRTFRRFKQKLIAMHIFWNYLYTVYTIRYTHCRNCHTRFFLANEHAKYTCNIVTRLPRVWFPSLNLLRYLIKHRTVLTDTYVACVNLVQDIRKHSKWREFVLLWIVDYSSSRSRHNFKNTFTVVVAISW